MSRQMCPAMMASGMGAPISLCHCETALFRRSNLLAVLEIASGEEQERPRNDMLLSNQMLHNQHVQLFVIAGDAEFFHFCHIKRAGEFNQAQEKGAAVTEMFGG